MHQKLNHKIQSIGVNVIIDKYKDMIHEEANNRKMS